MGDKLLPSQIIRALNKLERGWPSDLMLISNSGDLLLCTTGFNGHAYDEDLQAIPEERILATFPDIRNDGGDPGSR